MTKPTGPLFSVAYWLMVIAVVFSSQKVEAASPTCTSPRIRKELRDLSPTEWNAFTNAVVQLKQLGRYNAYITTHLTLAQVAHNGENFFPWHRRFIYDFETDILNLAGSNLTGLPYFDPHESYDMFDPTAPYYVGSSNGCIADGPFAGITRINGQCVNRAYTNTITAVDPRVIASMILNNTDFQTFSETYENGQHAEVHTAIGGVMGTIPESPSDPLFFLHHAHVDYVWYKRQWFDPTRLYWDINGQQQNQPVTLTSLIPGPWQRNIGLAGQISDTYWTLCYDYQDPSGRNNVNQRRLGRRQNANTTTSTTTNTTQNNSGGSAGGIFSPIDRSRVPQVNLLSDAQLQQLNIDPEKHKQVVNNLNTIVNQLNMRLEKGENLMSLSDIQKSNITPDRKVYGSSAPRSHDERLLPSTILLVLILQVIILNF